jgi:deoxyribonuclease (pyrimidine dimer)
MTRINVIDPSILSDKHLGAEYRELPRIFGLVFAAITRNEKPTDKRNPDLYVLGPGHVRFFYPRLGYLAARFNAIVAECKNRGRACQYEKIPEIYSSIPDEWKGQWTPTQEAIDLNISRINIRGGLRQNQG